jgi:CHAP domain
MAPRHADKLAATVTRAGLLGDGHATAAGSGASAANTVAYPCTSATPYGSVLIKPSQWAKGLINTGHDGANFNVYSNYASGSCDRPPASTDGSDAWGAPPQSAEYQCAELAIRVADAEWATGTQQAWVNVGHWDGSAADMAAPGQALGLTWTVNGSGTLPAPGDLMIWSSSGAGDPGHVAVVSAVTSTSVTFVGENQGYGMATVPVSGTTVEDNGFKGSPITGWLSHQWTVSTLGATSTSPPLPADAGSGGYAYLESVACPSKTKCVAVGHYLDSSDTWQGLIETLSGGSWKATEVTLPGNADGNPNAQLTSVACPSTTSCVAVGYYNDSTSALLVTGSGTNWTATEAPLPADAKSGPYAYLTSVACPSTTSCVAVGGYNGGSGGASSELIVAGAGSLWTATGAPLPLNGLSFYNASWPAVACMSASSCVTAWTYDDSSGTQQGVLESGSGINWTPSEAPLPANASTSNPTVVLGTADDVGRPLACSAATCVMVGQYVDSSGNTHGLLVTGSGTSWTPSEAPLPANAATSGGFGGLNSVACESATTCVAVGRYGIPSGGPLGLMLTGSGTSWTPAAAPVPPDAAAYAEVDLDSVTCPSTSWCVTAGAYASVAPDFYQVLAVIGAGTAWNTTPAPLPADAYSQTTWLTSVACPSKISCVAVGGYYDGNWHGLLATGAP